MSDNEHPPDELDPRLWVQATKMAVVILVLFGSISLIMNIFVV